LASHPRRQECPEESQADLVGCVPEKAEGLLFVAERVGVTP
jgi:hypothetical protein